MHLKSAVTFAFVALCLQTGCTSTESSGARVEGEYEAKDGKSRILLDADGEFAIEDRGSGVNIQFAVPGGRWTRIHDQVTLSWADLSKEDIELRSVAYTFTGKQGVIMLQLAHGQQLPADRQENPMGVILCATYRKEPNQPVQHNAGSRPSSGDSSASETPSSLGPRG